MKSGIISVKDNIFETLLAISEEEQSTGLMHQKWPPPIMSFVYKTPRINKFWMHNTISPLDIVFCKNGKISQIHQGEPFSTKMIGNNDESDLIIEFPLGTAKELKLQAGDEVSLISPNYDELKKIIRF